jgi:DNA-3-methyladenine glycosylase II
LAKIIDRIGHCKLRKNTDKFGSLVDAIVSQQLSPQAAATISRKLRGLFGSQNPTPSTLLRVSRSRLRSAGISTRKADTLHELAKKLINHQLSLDEIEGMSDEDAIKTLTSVKGIGQWTADMFLIFALNRPNIFPINDAALFAAMRNVYRLGDDCDLVDYCRISEQWQPHCTVAVWYLYAHLNELRGKLPKASRAG